MRNARKGWIAAAAAAVMFVGMAGCGSADTADDGVKTITIGVVATTAQDYDPYQALNYIMAAQPVYEPLFYSSETEEAITYAPAVAKTWKFNADFTKMTLDVQQGIRFQDGTALDAAAVKANLDYDLAITGNIFTGIGVTGSTVLDDDTLVITFDGTAGPERYQAFLACMSIASPTALEQDPKGLHTKPVGSGPYLLDQAGSQPGVKYVFTRFQDYWNPSAFAYDQVVLKFYPDQVSAANALTTGQIDFTELEATTAAQAKGAGLRVDTQTGRTTGLILGDRNGKQLAALADVRVRQAMNYAFDREAIAKGVYNGYAEPSAQAWNSFWPEYQEGGDPTYPYDPEKAKRLLAEAGYADGFELTIPTAGFPEDAAIKQQLGDIGIKVTYKTLPADGAEWNAQLRAAKYPVFYLNMGFENTIAYILRNGAQNNQWDNDDPELDKLIQRVNFGSESESAEAAPELGQYVLDKALLVPLVHPNLIWGVKPGIEVQYRVATANSPWLRDFRPGS